MTSFVKPPGYQPAIPYMAVLLKPRLVPIVKQPLVCLEPENKLGVGPVSPACPSWRPQPQGVPDYTQVYRSQSDMFSKGVD